MGSSTENRDEFIKHAKRVIAERDALKADLREYRNVCEEKQDIITCEVELNKSLKAENERLREIAYVASAYAKKQECIWCGQHRIYAHLPGCKLARFDRAALEGETP